jgi:hypothetical protein
MISSRHFKTQPGFLSFWYSNKLWLKQVDVFFRWVLDFWGAGTIQVQPVPILPVTPQGCD